MFFYFLIANENGELMIEGTENEKFENEYSLLFGHMNGEETAFTLISEDGLEIVSAVAVQKPLMALGKDGSVIKMRLATSKVDCFLVQCTGLNPNENFKYISTICHKKDQHTSAADAKGNWQTMLYPAVIGLEGGFGSLQIRRENGDDLKVNYLWGKDAIKVTRKEIEKNNSNKS